jgi:hypothetical protein
MSRPVPPRQAGGGGGAAPTQDWRAPWKRWAVEQLPTTASHAVRVEVRAAVERALARVPSTADEAEIRDLVLLVVDEAHERLNADAERKARHAQKTVVVASAGLLLGTALRKLSSRGAQRMLKRPGYSFQRLEYRLTHYLERHLTGEETRSDVQAHVEAWVEARLAEQPPTPGISKSALVAGGVTGVALGFVAAQHPAARDATARAIQKSRAVAQKGGEILSKLLTPPPAPPTRDA